MISEDTFEELFMEMAAKCGGRVLTAKQMKFWYKDLEYLDNQAFSATVRHFIQSGKYPESFASFKDVYHIQAASLGLRKEGKGCESCVTGFVHYWKSDKSYMSGLDIAWVKRCQHCNPDKFGRGYDGHINPAGLRIYNPNENPHSHNQTSRPDIKKLVEGVGESAPPPQNREERIAALQNELEKQAKEMVEDEWGAAHGAVEEEKQVASKGGPTKEFPYF